MTFERPHWTLDVIRPKKKWRKGNNTQAANLRAALDRSEGEVIVIIEDDDYYRPDWLETVANAIHGHHAVGEAPSRYYNVATGRCAMMRNKAPSLGCTAFRASLKNKLLGACQAGTYIDVHFWRGITGARILPPGRVVGIKGLPGRGGIGVGHRDDFGQADAGGSILRSWLGEDRSIYEQL